MSDETLLALAKERLGPAGYKILQEVADNRDKMVRLERIAEAAQKVIELFDVEYARKKGGYNPIVVLDNVLKENT